MWRGIGKISHQKVGIFIVDLVLVVADPNRKYGEVSLKLDHEPAESPTGQ